MDKCTRIEEKEKNIEKRKEQWKGDKVKKNV